MLQAIWEPIREYLKRQPYWSKVEPAEAFITAYVLSAVAGHQYITWQYQIALDIALYLKSYVFQQITVLFGTAALLLLALQLPARLARLAGKPRQEILRNLGTALRRKGSAMGFKLLLAVPVILAGGFLLHGLRPRVAANIPIKVLHNDDAERHIDIETLAYIIYELNKHQRSWYFVLDVQELNPRALEKDCSPESRMPLCEVESYFQGRPGIGITTVPLGEGDHFWEHLDRHSVITTNDIATLMATDAYDYLAYALIIQGAAIHLEESCGGIESVLLERSHESSGDVLQLSPPQESFKATMLAARLSPHDQELLLQCFGPGYLSDVTRLIALDWLRSGAVAENLARHFHLKRGG